MNFLLPQGIGDSVWALLKIEDVSNQIGDGRIDVWVSAEDRLSPIHTRAVDFVRRFSFVDSVESKPIATAGNPVVSPEGYYNYIADGRYELEGQRFVALMPNASLERGHRLEDWLPHYRVNWDIFDKFNISRIESKVGDNIRALGDYAVFYFGPLAGNTRSGHNRGGLWPPENWAELGKRIHDELGLRIVVVGAEYDQAYANLFVYPLLNGDASFWTNFIGRTNIGELYSITSNAKLLVSYQSGVGIVSTYLGTPTAIFWRPKGDSLAADGYLSFEEEMASAWVPPRTIESGKHLPVIYGRHGVDYIFDWARRWV